MSTSDNVASLLAEATQRIAAALALDKREARIEARVLLAHALEVDHAWLIAHDRDTPTDAQFNAIEDLIIRRTGGEPIAYILGEREFFGRTFKVTPDVLIPRPETELLIETALARLPRDHPTRILDLGTGSGCIAISLALERPDCEVWAVDKSKAALSVAHENAVALGVNIHWHLGHWFESIEATCFDVIVSNPPYIAETDPHLMLGDVQFEPRSALVSGVAGLDDLQALISLAPERLTREGWLLLEHGYDQGSACRVLFHRQNYRNIDTLKDIAGHPRVTGARRPAC